jgi:hypothetical protein
MESLVEQGLVKEIGKSLRSAAHTTRREQLQCANVERLLELCTNSSLCESSRTSSLLGVGARSLHLHSLMLVQATEFASLRNGEQCGAHCLCLAYALALCVCA